MAFKELFLAHVPDAEPEKHKCVIETPKYKLFARIDRPSTDCIARGACEAWNRLANSLCR